jgi:pimeloyl-ACP methyl ester carboxylesterase
MPQIETNGIRLEYETWGEPTGRPLVVVRGLGTQLVHWSPRLCERLVAAGHYLVTFDNRDVGLSTHFHEAGMPDLAGILAARARGEEPEAPYRLADMATDLIGLMDGLGLSRAHVAGMSMGGMIVQQAALQFPDRLASMTSIMSTTGDPGLPGPTPEAAAALSRPPPRERSAYVDYSVLTQRAFTGRGFPFDEEGWRDLAGRVFDRAFDPAGVARQMAAIMASGSRHADLAKVSTPTLVVHGTDDPLVPPACGEATARAIPGARLHWIEGMGHDLPEGAWPDLVDAIAAHTAAAEA